MDAIELSERIKKGENIRTEFKENLPDNEALARSIVCFANADGGQLIIGVDNSGSIAGIQNLDEAMRIIDDVAFNRCEPAISILQETVEIDDKCILVISVPKGEQRPYRTRSGFYYIRSGNRCRQASWDEVRRLYQVSESIFYDESPVNRASIVNLDLYYFMDFLEKYLDISPEEGLVEVYLKNLRIITDDKKPTLAGLLFFGRNPQQFIYHSKIIAAYISGTDIAIPPYDKKDLEGRIPDILDNAVRYLKLYLREEHIIKGIESELYPELHEVVLREAVVNAIAHRDYTISASIRILIFDDRVEIRTPGKLPNTVTIDYMKMGCHVLRNPTIYNLLYKTGVVTDTGSGIRRIIKLTKQSTGKEVSLKVTDGEFVLTLPRKNDKSL